MKAKVDFRRLVVPAVALAAFAAALVVVLGDPIVSWWNFRIGPWIDSVENWIIIHQDLVSGLAKSQEPRAMSHQP